MPKNTIPFLALWLAGLASAQVIPGRYIVQLAPAAHDDAVLEAVAAAESRTPAVRGRIYRRAIRGFSISLPPGYPAERLYNIPGVVHVEPDIALYKCVQTIPTGVRRINAHRSPVANINGLDQRVDVGVAVIDTGIQPDHPDLNVVGGRRFYTIATGPLQDRTRSDDQFQDTDGHGTHVAGIIGALDNTFGVVGVAPGARLWALKVFPDGSSSAAVSDVLGALEWVIQNAHQIEVVNMSLGGTGTSVAYRTAIQNTVAQGIVVIAAAGNDAKDIYGDDGIFGTSDDFIPAAFPEVATVSALADNDGRPGGVGGNTGTGPDDSFANFSNYSAFVVPGNPVSSPGAAIDLMMPGARIRSTDLNGTYSNKWGTSMAAPHAAGLAALYIAAHGRATNAAGVYAIRQALIDSASGQTSPRGLNTQNDPDSFKERIGYIIPADFNLDGRVDELDLMIFAAAWLTDEISLHFDPRCDIHLPPDGRIDIKDFAEFAAYWLVGYD